MKNDTAMEEFFARYQPDLGDKEKYMEHISKKLEAAEYVKKYQKEQARRFRHRMVGVFVAGTVTGAVCLAVLLLHPLWLLPAQNVSGSVLSATMAWLPKILLLLATCMASLCITGLVLRLQVFERRDVR